MASHQHNADSFSSFHKTKHFQIITLALPTPSHHTALVVHSMIFNRHRGHNKYKLTSQAVPEYSIVHPSADSRKGQLSSVAVCSIAPPGDTAEGASSIEKDTSSSYISFTRSLLMVVGETISLPPATRELRIL